ncbi:hypothetical protein A2U01_0092491, partial [Trifolium medium]|nr:hypothetical protein [Trifolium medium]
MQQRQDPNQHGRSSEEIYRA